MELDHPQHESHKQPDTLLTLPAKTKRIAAQEAKEHQMLGHGDGQEQEPYAHHGHGTPIAPHLKRGKHGGWPLLPCPERADCHE